MEHDVGGVRNHDIGENGVTKAAEMEKEEAEEKAGMAMHGVYLGWPNVSQWRTHHGQCKRRCIQVSDNQEATAGAQMER